MTYLSNMVADGLTDTSLPIKERMVHQARAFKFIHQFANELKVDDRLVEVVESSINSLGDSVKNHKPLNELINEVLSHKEGHLFQGAYLTNIMSLHLLKQESMDQEDNINQIIFASLFSDIGMSNPIMYLTSTDEQLNSNFEKNQWTEDEFKQVRHHPKNNAQLLENYPNISRKALRIIQEHHGSDLGIGFNLKPEDSISDLSKIFLTANCFILNFLNPLNKFNKKEIIEMIQSQGDKRIQELVAHFNKKIQ
jgi:response regulator RpfG family c-di-GMP phosphodiesterase